MKTIIVPSHSLKIRPVTLNELEAVLQMYKQCEDFLSLGPVPIASMEMVLKDMELSQETGGHFCGIYSPDGVMIGVIDFISGNYNGDPGTAFLELLMIAKPYRSSGVGTAVVTAFESEVRKDAHVHTIRSGVQVNNPKAVEFWQRNGYRIVGGPTLMPDQTTVYSLQKDL